MLSCNKINVFLYVVLFNLSLTISKKKDPSYSLKSIDEMYAKL